MVLGLLRTGFAIGNIQCVRTKRRDILRLLKTSQPILRNVKNRTCRAFSTGCETCDDFLDPPIWEPKRDGQYRCEATFKGAEEPMIQYQKDGYHPVHLGDYLHDRRYLILSKLGWGRDATIWLANDLKLCKKVALKIFRAGPTSRLEADAERQVLTKTNSAAMEKNEEGVVGFLDEFELKGELSNPEISLECNL